MRDEISRQRLLGLHPSVREDFRQFIEDAEESLNITLRITQGLRTFEEQQALYDLGRTKPGKVVTMAKPGSSYHQYGLAVDLVEVIGKEVDWGYDMSRLIPFAFKQGIFWGGHFTKFKDRPHFEKTLNYNWRDLLAKYNAKDFIPGTEFVNI